MKTLLVEVVKFISDEPQPGIVECKFIDANGREWTFIEKTAIVSEHPIDADSEYPRSGEIACEIVERKQGGSGREIVLVDTIKPWGITATTGESIFELMLRKGSSLLPCEGLRFTHKYTKVCFGSKRGCFCYNAPPQPSRREGAITG